MRVKGILDLLKFKYQTDIDIFYITINNIDVSIWHDEYGYIYDAEIDNNCIIGFFSNEEYLTINLKDEIQKLRNDKIDIIIKK